MIRVVKDPDERKEELINCAEEMFTKFGYDETSVSDIVKKAKVAQGTFYYYFKSKDDIRNAIIDRYIAEVKSIIDNIIDNKDLSALEKMTAYSVQFRDWGMSKGKLIDYIHEKKNEVLHSRMANRVLGYLGPAYTKIIKQGIEEGIFHTEYPEESAQAIMGMTETIFGGEHHPDMTRPDMRKKYMSILHFTELILEAEPGLFMRFLTEKGVQL